MKAVSLLFSLVPFVLQLGQTMLVGEADQRNCRYTMHLIIMQLRCLVILYFLLFSADFAIEYIISTYLVEQQPLVTLDWHTICIVWILEVSVFLKTEMNGSV